MAITASSLVFLVNATLALCVGSGAETLAVCDEVFTKYQVPEIRRYLNTVFEPFLTYS